MRIIPVIHFQNDEQALRNATLAFEKGCFGVFVIAMDRRDQIVKNFFPKLRAKFPDKHLGVNFLSMTPINNVINAIQCGADMSWSDYPILSSTINDISMATDIRKFCLGEGHNFFTSCAFKYQEPEPNPSFAAQLIAQYEFIPTTSGNATGEPTDLNKCIEIVKALPVGTELAIASGITPENARSYVDAGISYGLVATGISKDFFNIDESKLALLMENI